MIRFVEIGEVEGFAFFDTVTDNFVKLGGIQSWDSELDFVESALAAGVEPNFIKKCIALIPKKRRRNG